MQLSKGKGLAGFDPDCPAVRVWVRGLWRSAKINSAHPTPQTVRGRGLTLRVRPRFTGF